MFILNKNFFKKCVMLTLTAALCVSVTSCKKEKKKSALEEASTSDAQTKVLEEAKSHSRIDSDDAAATDSPASNSENSGSASIGGADGPTDVYVSNEVKEYAPGKISGNTFESAYIGVKFTTPNGYTLAAEDFINKQNELFAASDNEGQKYLRYEAIIINKDEQMQVVVSVDGNKADYDELNYLGNVAATYRSIGAEIDETPLYATIAGHEYTTMKISSEQGNILYCVRKKDDHVIAFIISHPDNADDKIEAVMNAFTPY